MADWTDSLRFASFRGVPFEVESVSFSGGRRVAVYEMPGRDQAVTEDLGRKPRLAPFAAYVIGDDAQAQSFTLIQALEAEGPGLLVHPVFGELMVNSTDYALTLSWDQGRALSLSLSFVEAGELEFIDVDTGEELDAAADALDLSAADYITDALDTGGMPGVLVDAMAAISAALDAVEAIVATPFAIIADAAELVSDIAALKARVSALAQAPEDLAAAMTALLARIGDLVGLRSLAGAAGEEMATAAPDTADARQRIANAYAVRRLLTQSALAAASRVLRDTDLTVYDDAISERDALAALLSAEQLSADDAGADACAGLRGAIVSDVTARAARLARLTTYTPPAVVPMVTIASRLYGDAERQDEIIERNGILHPLFVPAEALRVLTS
jgi:prophage DNA circulation protein